MATSDSSEPSNGSLTVLIGKSDDVDEVTGAEIVSLTLFDLGAQAVGEDDQQGLTLIAGFASVSDAETARAALLDRHGSLVQTATVAEVEATSWVEAQRSGFQPTQLGPWHIRGPWHDEPGDEVLGERDIIIDPGVAFGHGAHPSTRLAVELMLRHLDGPSAPTRVIDIGTGTGVAAIIAARAGASVLAIDNDEDAIDVAWSNIERNSAFPFDETQDRIELVLGDAAELSVEADDLVVANLTLGVQRLVAERCRSAERLILSGILCKQVRATQDLYPGHWASTIRTNGEWAAVEYSSTECMGRKN